METETIFAALNDENKLNSTEALDLFGSINKNISLDKLDISVLTGFLTAIKEDGEKRSEVAAQILSALGQTDLSYYQEYLNKVRDEGAEFYTFLDKEYPESLSNIQSPPLGIYLEDWMLRNWILIPALLWLEHVRLRIIDYSLSERLGKNCRGSI